MHGETPNRNAHPRVLSGALPIAPTPFDERDEVDHDGQKRIIDFLIDAQVDAICILANYSEQFALTDDERERLTTLALDHVAGRVPVIVTTSHFSQKVAAERSRRAQQAGAAMVMLMPPYHGATIRPDDPEVFDFFRAVADVVDIPIMIQDAPVSGVTLSAAALARLAREIPQVQYVKVEVPGAASKLRQLIQLAGDTLPGPFDGEEGITLLPDLDAGATGTMPSALQPDLLRVVVQRHRAGDRPGALTAYERSLPLILLENRQCGLRAAKVVLHEGGIIRCERARPPTPPLHPATRAALLEQTRRLDPLILRWAR
jgi:dihydrodipicolinate synthase/N-acetylneuraminate lyase